MQNGKLFCGDHLGLIHFMAHAFLFTGGIEQMLIAQADYKVCSPFHDLMKPIRAWFVQKEMESTVGPQNYLSL